MIWNDNLRVFKTIRILRTIYILFMAYFIMHIVIFLGLATNISGISSHAPSESTIINGQRAIMLLLIVMCFLTAGYRLIEYGFNKKLKLYPNGLVLERYSKRYTLFLSYLYFFIFSYLNFLISYFLISKGFFPVLISTVLLNFIPIFIIYKHLISKHIDDKKVRRNFWIASLILSFVMIFPYSSIVFNAFNFYVMPFVDHKILIVIKWLGVIFNYIGQH